MNTIENIQKMIKGQADAYLLVDYENKNPILVSLLGEKMLTRKIFLLIPKEGRPKILAHVIDSVFLKDDKIAETYDLILYKTWEEMLTKEKEITEDYPTLMMDVSFDGLLPRVALADWGSVDYLIRLGHHIISSKDIQQYLYAHFTTEEEESQKEATAELQSVMNKAFLTIKSDIETSGHSSEYRIQKVIRDTLTKDGYIYDDPAIVAVGKNASVPHYGPTKEVESRIDVGQVVLIDMWAKKKETNSVYGDITWMGYTGKEVPKEVEERFQILRKAVDEGFEFLKRELPKRDVFGFEVDDVVRNVVKQSGYGDYFIHRTGHNIAKDVSPHGPGANIDNYESHDDRKLIPGTSFSLEPGIYAPDFGMRSETDIYLDENNVPHMVGGRQEHVIAILK